MKYRDILFREPPRFLRKADAEIYVGAGSLLKEMQDAKWLAPVVSRHRLTLFDRKDLDACCDRIRAGQLPGVYDPD